MNIKYFILNLEKDIILSMKMYFINIIFLVLKLFYICHRKFNVLNILTNLDIGLILIKTLNTRLKYFFIGNQIRI